MARSATTLHGINKAGASTDTYVMTDDYTNLIDRFENALAGLGAYAAGTGYINSNANNAGKIISAIGGSYRGRVIGVNAADDAMLIFQDNAGTTGTDKYATGYDDSRDALGMTYVGGGAALGANGAEITAAGNWNAIQDMELRAGRWTSFLLEIRNNAGTIEHRMMDGNGAASSFVGKVTGASTSYATTPSVAAGVDFASGGGKDAAATEAFVLNVAAQTAGRASNLMATVLYNDTGTALTLYAFHGNIDVNGTTRKRWHIRLKNATTGADFLINTTNITASKFLYLHVFGWIE